MTSFLNKPFGMAVWDIHSGKISHTFGMNAFFAGLIQIDNRHAACATDNSEIQIWDFLNGRYVRSFEGHTRLIGSVLKLNEDTILSCSLDGSLRSWDVATGRSHILLESIRPLKGMVRLEPGVCILSGEYKRPYEPCKLDWWNLQTGKQIASLPLPGSFATTENLVFIDNEALIIQYDDGVQTVNDHHQRWWL